MTQSEIDFPVTVCRSFRRASFVVLGIVSAVMLWAGFAPITSTLQIQGSLTTLQPVVDLQHLTGGRIAEVLVRRLDYVEKGQLLLRFDESDAVEVRALITNQIAMLEAELHSTGPSNETHLPSKHSSSDVSVVLVEVANRRSSYVADANRLEAELEASETREKAVSQEIATLLVLVTIATERVARIRQLVEQNFRIDNDLADAEEQLATATLSLQARKSDQAETINRSAIGRIAIISHQANFAATMASIRRQDTERVIELQHRLAELDAQIGRAEVRAPVAGTVVSLPFDTAGDVARAGEVLAQISAPIEGFEIKLQVPVRYIDQVAVGKRGTILILALPQRQMPRVEITVSAIATSAELDADGSPTSYAALALFDAADVAPMLNALGPDYNIVRDMSVVVMLEGRATTPLSYFLEPLRTAAQLAFEEG